MTVQHPAPDELLLDYAAGTLPEPMALLVACHLSLCPESAAMTRQLEAVGGALLDTEPAAEVGSDALDRLMDRLDDVAQEPPAAAIPASEASDSPLPAPLRDCIDGPLESQPWRTVGGIGQLRLFPEREDVDVRLLDIPASKVIPLHTHAGEEFTLVLEGGFSDGRGHYVRGDVCTADADVNHSPVADADGRCLCLAVTTGDIRLTGPLGRIIDRFVRY